MAEVKLDIDSLSNFFIQNL